MIKAVFIPETAVELADATTNHRLLEASKVMRDRAQSCRSMADAMVACRYHGEAVVQRARAEAYDAAALTLQEMAENRA